MNTENFNKQKVSVVVTNDKKEKSQSWEAAIDFNGGWVEACFSVSITGYGANKEESVYELKNAIIKLTGLLKDAVDNTN